MLRTAASGGLVPRVYAADLSSHVGRRVRLNGWLTSSKKTKTTKFLLVRDRTGVVQGVCQGPEWDDLVPLSNESALEITGRVRESRPNNGCVEIAIDAVRVLARSESDLPVGWSADRELRLDYRFLDLRSRRGYLTFAVQTTFESTLRGLLLERGFVEIHSPKISSGGSESGAAVFSLPYFGESACLVQSPQFYMQLAAAAGFDKIFEVGPAFRAEAATTDRHAAEFTSVDVEMSWIESADELMELEEELLWHTLQAVKDVYEREIRELFGVEVDVPKLPIPRVSVSEALRIANLPAGDTVARLTHRAEQVLSRYAWDTLGSSFVFLTNFPASARPFYTMVDESLEAGHDRPTRSFDLLWRGIEITSGCQREHRFERLREQASVANMDTATMAKYLDKYYFPMFCHGCPPHGGFGIGLNRVLLALLGRRSIQETSFVFRGPERLVP